MAEGGEGGCVGTTAFFLLNGKVGSSCALGPAEGRRDLLYLTEVRGGGRKDSGRAATTLPSAITPEVQS